MAFPYISKEFPLILASASPRRRELLAGMGIPFRSITSRIPEESYNMELSDEARFLAEIKAKDIFSLEEGFWILGADTIVAIEGTTLGKPADRKEAEYMLAMLGGKQHSVSTGFCILDPSGNIVHSEAVTTIVKFKDLSNNEIDGYIETGEPFDKAGSYAIQGIGAFMVESISGSYTNVVGLPICAVLKALISVGALERFPFKI